MPANCKIDEFELQNINQAYALSFKKEVGFRINYLHVLLCKQTLWLNSTKISGVVF